jgi:D-alanyl-D-alanine-carboxypeptidase/D-alanyl-D-alanine-endopeptidase
LNTFALCMIILSLFLNQKEADFHSMTKVKVDSIIIQSATQIMNDTSMVGLSIGLYYNGDDFFQNFGSIEKGKEISPTKNTVYEIGSITKTFTGILLANAVLENKIDLNDDILAYLDDKYDNLRHNEIPIRIINLANHSSGLPEDIIPPEFYSLEKPTMYDIINVYEGDRGEMFLRDLHDKN